MGQMVVFDLGNVLVDWDPFETQRGEVSRADWDAFLSRTDFWEFNRLLDGGLDFDEARRVFTEEHAEDADFLDRYLGRFGESIRGNIPGMEQVVADLKARGTRIAGLSNWPEQTYHFAEERSSLVGELEDVVVSGRVKMRKPNPDIFHYMLDLYGVPAGDVVFVDDVQENVDAAASLGIDAVLFTGADDLRAELVARGLI